MHCKINGHVATLCVAGQECDIKYVKYKVTTCFISFSPPTWWLGHMLPLSASLSRVGGEVGEVAAVEVEVGEVRAAEVRAAAKVGVEKALKWDK